MNIEKKIKPYIVYYEDSIQFALDKINKNSKRLVYCLFETGVLYGLVTDGDFRRWVVKVKNIDLKRPVKEIVNQDYVFASDDDNNNHIESLFSPKVSSVPIIDGSGRLTAIAWQESQRIRLGERLLGDDKPAFLIAEIGNNHNGSLDLAKKLIDQAAEAGADCAKFQLRHMQSIYNFGGNEITEDLGTEYNLDLLNRFQLNVDDMYKAFDHTKECGIIPLCTPWDVLSLKRLSEYGVDGYKISSPDLTNHELIKAATKTRKPLLLSTGMSTELEILDAIQLLRNESASFILLQCNSTYPVPMHEINLKYMDRLREIANVPVGYSGHERGFEICIAAVARGAKVIEKHFTLDREMEGNDHRVSLLQSEFTSMVRSIRNVEEAIGCSDARTIGQGERLNREILAKSLIALFDIKRGQEIKEHLIDVRSPGRGLQPSRKKDLIGVIACRDMKKGDFFFESDIVGETLHPRAYYFDRPWGIPVRYYDFNELTKTAPLDFVEFHFSYRDLEKNPEDFIDEPTQISFVVHCPELFSGDHIMDLSSSDDTYRMRSINELQNVINCTRNLKKFFPKSIKPLIVINAGGFTFNNFISLESRKLLYERIGDSFNELDADGVEIIPQTMPPFPWLFGGQRYHNLFVDYKEIVSFCKKYNIRICLDISHSQLACNYYGFSMNKFIHEVGPYIAHLHIVDARGNNDEGLQIGEGDIDFENLFKDLRQCASGIPFIPEIWQGHKNGGEGFWRALNVLESKSKITEINK
jgi:sialic acid synthase SpsE/sugar phosphate isomerase/epimerase